MRGGESYIRVSGESKLLGWHVGPMWTTDAHKVNASSIKYLGLQSKCIYWAEIGPINIYRQALLLSIFVLYDKSCNYKKMEKKHNNKLTFFLSIIVPINSTLHMYICCAICKILFIVGAWILNNHYCNSASTSLFSRFTISATSTYNHQISKLCLVS